MRSIYDLVDNINEKIYRMVQDMECVSAKELGLDYRCGMLSINEECIIIEKRMRGSLEYYGGFEYCDKDFVQHMGDYVIYLNGDNRVARCLERYYETHLTPAEQSGEA